MFARYINSTICCFFLVLALGAGGGAPPEEPAPSTISIRVAFFFEKPPSPGAITLVVRPRQIEPNEDPIEVALDEPRLYELKVHRDLDLKLACTGMDYWCPETSITPGKTESEIYIPVFRSVSISGIAKSYGGSEPASNLLVQGWLRLSEKSNHVVSFSQEIELTDTKQFQFLAPEGTLDLRMAAEGWVPHYVWGFKSSGKAKKLGELRFRRGSSLSGFVWDGVTDLPAKSAAVKLVPGGIVPESTADQRVERLIHEAQTNDRGFFQLSGMPPGVYQLDVIGEKRALRTIDSIEILEESETYMNTKVVLSPLVQVEVHLNPPFYYQEKPWSLQLVAHGNNVDDMIKKAVTDDVGSATFSGLLPQAYRLEILDTAGESTYLVKEITVEEDEILYYDVPVVELLGELTLNDEPLAASVRIGTGSADKTLFKSDPEIGQFSGVIRKPKNDLLFVSIRSEDSDFSRSLVMKNLEIEDGLLEVKLHLVGVDVPGIVVDREGRPVSGAKVSARSGRWVDTDSKSDARGEFTLIALDEGQYELRAESAAKGFSDPVSLEIRKGLLPPFQRLVLEPGEKLSGVLRSADGQPVPGARITAWAVGATGTGDSAVSDVEGKYQLDIGAGSTHVLLKVFAPSQVLWSGCLKLAPEAERQLSLTLPRLPGARLELGWTGSRNGPPDTSKRFVLLTSEGGFLTFNDYFNWTALTGNPEGLATFSGGDWVFPRIAGGLQYAALESAKSELEIATEICLLGPSPRLDWVYLPEGGSERIEIDLGDP